MITQEMHLVPAELSSVTLDRMCLLRDRSPCSSLACSLSATFSSHPELDLTPLATQPHHPQPAVRAGTKLLFTGCFLEAQAHATCFGAVTSLLSTTLCEVPAALSEVCYLHPRCLL